MVDLGERNCTRMRGGKRKVSAGVTPWKSRRYAVEISALPHGAFLE